MVETSKSSAKAGTPAPPPPGAIDLDAMLEKRLEVVGSADKFPFTYKGETYWGTDPTLADDDWTDELRALSRDPEAGPVDVAAHYLGEEQWEKFSEAGGSANLWGQALQAYLEKQREVDAGGHPTRAPSFSNRSQRRQKRR